MEGTPASLNRVSAMFFAKLMTSAIPTPDFPLQKEASSKDHAKTDV